MENLKEGWDRAWRYFQLHAGQRMSTFNFFIIVAALLTNAQVATFSNDFEFPVAGYIVSVALITASAVFWKLDQRVRQLIHHAEDSLKEIETECEALYRREEKHYIPLFLGEEKKTGGAQNSVWQGFFRESLKYSQCFGLLYMLFAAFGFVSLIMQICRD